MNKYSHMDINLAVMILAHKNLSQLIRLVRSLHHPNIDIFIHLDEKWKLTEMEIDQIKSIDNNHVQLCLNRISAFLDKWSLVEATMEIVRTIKEREKEKKINYQYYALLSGQDYPIKSMDYLIHLLSLAYPKPYIDCTPYHKKNWLKKKFKTLPVENVIQLWFRHHMDPGILRKIAKLPFFIYLKILKTFIPTPYKKLIKLNCGLYGGSAWWILPDIVINEINLRYFHSNDNIINILSKTFTPEETFFQIMTMQSEAAPLVEINPIMDTKQNCLTYAHFKDVGKPFIGHPYILDIYDIAKLKDIPQCFARKFDDTFNSQVLGLIDEGIQKNRND